MRYVLMGFSAWPLATSLAKALAENTCRYTMERPPLLHRQLMSVFVSAGLISAPGTPCTPLQFETLCYQRCTHTHTHAHTHMQPPAQQPVSTNCAATLVCSCPEYSNNSRGWSSFCRSCESAAAQETLCHLATAACTSFDSGEDVYFHGLDFDLRFVFPGSAGYQIRCGVTVA